MSKSSALALALSPAVLAVVSDAVARDTAASIAKYEAMNDFRAIAANYRRTPGLFSTEASLSATKVPVPASRHLKDTVLPSVEAVDRFLAPHRNAP